MGPTASGKTALAIELARRFPVSLISVDSALVYRDMVIGTARPDAATLGEFPHRLIDLVTPEESYSAARFCRDASAAMTEIANAGRIPLLVGGTMLYYKTLLFGLADLPPADPALRAEIDQEAAEKGWSALHAELMQRDPVTAARLSPNDSQRLQRALEICRLTGEPMSARLAKSEPHASPALLPPYRFLAISLLPLSRAELHVRINTRFRAMLATGLCEELVTLQKRYRLTSDLPAMRAVGYRQTWAYLAGEYGLPGQPNARETLAERGSAATRQLAKRQMTWLANTLPGEVFDCFDPALHARATDRVARFLAPDPASR
jgi:tRNA dimethylallyltransferase